MKIGIVSGLLIVVGALLTLAMLLTAGWERPPMDSTQVGYRGTGMVQIDNPRTEAALDAKNAVPPPPYEFDAATAEGGPTAGEFYENVTVLTDISAEEFNYLMAAITEWVSPEEGCGYCHNLENLASDELYTKQVSRRMIQMTQTINVDWTDHVKQTGVTCYTCHRGQPWPQYVWYQDDSVEQPTGMAGYRPDNQNIANERAGYTSLPSDTLSAYLRGGEELRIASTTNEGLNSGFGAPIQKAEKTYGLMMHMSKALGVNCTFCHNTRALAVWDQSGPTRSVAWYGLQMLAKINQEYILPLASVLPDYRKGPHGDTPAASCATCHQGVSKPLLGQPMAKDYPALTQKTGGGTAIAPAGNDASGQGDDGGGSSN